MKETVKIIAPEICLLPDGPAHHAGVVVACGSICATGELEKLRAKYTRAAVQT